MGSCRASNPSQIFYSVTIRDFIDSRCRIGLTLSSFCPLDGLGAAPGGIQDQVTNGLVSGHEDFQVNSANELYDNTDCLPNPYFGIYTINKTDEKRLPRFGSESEGDDRRPACLSKNNPPVFYDDLIEDDAGIPKMSYCAGGSIDGVACETETGRRTIFSRDSFERGWYKDNRKYNKRFGYQQELNLTSGQTYF